MSESGFTVSTEALVVHGSSVRAAAVVMGQCASAGGTVRADAGAFGVLCSFLPALLNPVEQVVIGALGASGTCLESVVGALAATVATYEHHEVANGELFAGIGTQLGSGGGGL